jgi:hypothetical protein
MNSTTSTLADVDRSNAPTPFLEPEKDRAAAGFSDSSTRAPSTDLELEKNTVGGETDTDTVDAGAQPQSEELYPTGVRLGMIVVALVLSIFLVSLDMVSSPVCINIDTTDLADKI